MVVPVYRPGLSADERVSLRHLERILGGCDRFLVVPKSLRFGLDGFGVKRFPDRFLESRRAYSALMLSRRFYSSCADYDYVLIYQLDCLVFRDELRYWCEQDRDSIGAMHKIGDRSLPGNGSFSLRRISSFLDVLNSKTVDPGEHNEPGLRFAFAESPEEWFRAGRPATPLWLSRLERCRTPPFCEASLLP